MKKLTLAILPLLLLVACKQESKKAEAQPIKVEVFEVQQMQDGGVGKHYVGKAEENFSSQLSFPMGGYIDRIEVSVGDFVKKGDLLAVLDKTSAESSHNAAKSSLKQARDGYNRLKKVYEKGSLAEVKWVEMQTKLEQAKSVEKAARKMLEDCELKAPYDGVITSRNGERGVNLLPSQPVLGLADVSQIKIRISVPETEIAAVSVGQQAQVRISALGDSSYIGTVTEKGVEADNLSHSYPVRLTIENPDNAILPGMVCMAYLQNEAMQSGFCVPAKAVQLSSSGQYVWVIENDIAKRKPVKIGDFVGDKVSVLNGLDSGDKVVVSGFLKLSEGTEVQVTE